MTIIPRANGRPGTIDKIIRYTVYCGTCPDQAMDTRPDQEAFERTIKQMGWRKRGGRWYCSFDCAEASKESEQE